MILHPVRHAQAPARNKAVVGSSLKSRRRRARVFVRGKEAVLAVEAQLVVERLQTYLQKLGGACLVVVGLLERAQNHHALDLVNGRADGERDRVRPARARAGQ